MIVNTLLDRSLAVFLKRVNCQYYNLKQETPIKDALIRLINKTYNGITVSAYSEFPRENSIGVKGRKRPARDLCIVANGKAINTIEIKYQYPKDFGIKDVAKKILNDTKKNINNQQCTHFLLIVHERQGLKTSHLIKKQIAPVAFPDNEGSFEILNNKCNNYVNYRDNVWRKIDRNHILFYIPVTIDQPYINTYHFLLFEFIENDLT